MMYHSLDAQIQEIDYELGKRAEVYPRLVHSGKERASVLDMHVDRLRAAKRTLEWLRDNEAMVKQRLS